MARQDRDRIERPVPRRRVVAGDENNGATGGDTTGSTPAPSSSNQSGPRPDPLADLAPVYTVDELAPVFTSPSPSTTGGSSATQPPSTPLTPSTGSTPITPTTSSGRPAPAPLRPAPLTDPNRASVSVPVATAPPVGFGMDDDEDFDDDEADENDDDGGEGSNWLRIVGLAMAIVASLLLIAYGVNGIRKSRQLANEAANGDQTEETQTEEPAEGTTPEGDGESAGGESAGGDDSSSGGQPAEVQGVPLELTDDGLPPDITLTSRRALANGPLSTIVITNPNDANSLSMASLKADASEWVTPPSQSAFTAIGTSTEGLIGVAAGGTPQLAQSSDGGASWAEHEGGAALPPEPEKFDLVAENLAGVLFATSEVPADHRADVPGLLGGAGVALDANMVAGASATSVSFLEATDDPDNWYQGAITTAAWSDFGVADQTDWAAHPADSPRVLYLAANGAVEQVPDPFGSDQFLVSLGLVGGDFQAITYDGSATGFTDWRSSDGKAWNNEGPTNRPPLVDAPQPSSQSVTLGDTDWRILTLPDRDPALTRRAQGGDWELVPLTETVGGVDLTGYLPGSLAFANDTMTLTLRPAEGRQPVVAQTTDGTQWKVAQIDAPHLEVSANDAATVIFGTDADPFGTPATVVQVRTG